jgi:hypothetical protein
MIINILIAIVVTIVGCISIHYFFKVADYFIDKYYINNETIEKLINEI